MGMACEPEGRAAVAGERVMPLVGGVCGSVRAEGGDTLQAAASGAVKVDGAVAGDVVEAAGVPMNTEETAMILTSLSKGQFGAGGAGHATGDSDGDDMGEFSDDEGEHGDAAQFGGGSKVHRVQQINFDGPKGSKLDFTDDAGFSHRFRNESNRVKSLVTKHISIEELRAHFDRPIIDVAKDFGICITLMKKICRRNGIKRWPHRQIRSLSKSIASMEAAMLSAHGNEREKYRDQIVNLKMKRESVIADPNKDNAMRPKTPPPSMPRSDLSLNGHGLRVSHQAPSSPKLSPRAGPSSQTLPSIGIPSTPTVKMENLAVGTPSAASGHSKGGRWTSEEHAAFLEGIRLYGKDWRRVAQVVRTRSAVQTRTHAQKYLLKFAGRFPFDAEGLLKDQQHAHVQTAIASASHQDVAMLSPTTSSAASSAAMTPASDDSSSSASWNAEEQSHGQLQAPAKHGEAMAMILNSSPKTEPEAGASLPPLASRTAIKLESGSSTTGYQHQVTPSAFLYPQQPQLTP
ncbi:hypothetical protein BBJ28_00000902 [Nothophytophthora sp. Chile5]|nr:hypothetical protein BBJ28_00000902 [Nothophytophthora sp. Chile5]